MESDLCVIYFVDDDRHLVKVEKKGLETLLRYSKFHCDGKIVWSCSTKQEDQTKITST